MIRSELFNWCLGHRSRQRSLQQQSAVRPPETQFTVRPPLYLVALFVDGAVMVRQSIVRFDNFVGPPCAQWRM